MKVRGVQLPVQLLLVLCFMCLLCSNILLLIFYTRWENPSLSAVQFICVFFVQFVWQVNSMPKINADVAWCSG